MFVALARLINSLTQLFILVVIVDSLLSFFLPPYHPLREALDRFLEPLLMPIRRVVPLVAGLDFSPLVLIILVQVLSTALINFLLAI